MRKEFKESTKNANVKIIDSIDFVPGNRFKNQPKKIKGKKDVETILSELSKSSH